VFALHREANYQKKITHVGSRCHERRCATRLQARWRGHRARAAWYEVLRLHYRQVGGTLCCAVLYCFCFCSARCYMF
jgi:hypothetical protein